MADVPGYTYVNINRPSTGTVERTPVHWTYTSNYGPWIKPNVPWPSVDAPKAVVDSYEDPLGIAPTSWVDSYGELKTGKVLPLSMPAGIAEPPELIPAPEPEPEPEPDPVPVIPPTLPERVAAFLGRPDDVRTTALAETHVPVIGEYVNAYTRSVGPVRAEDGSLSFPADLAAVIVSAASRLVVNPSQLDREAYDGYSAAGSFKGFTIPELAVLNRYRRRVG